VSTVRSVAAPPAGNRSTAPAPIPVQWGRRVPSDRSPVTSAKLTGGLLTHVSPGIKRLLVRPRSAQKVPTDWRSRLLLNHITQYSLRAMALFELPVSFMTNIRQFAQG